MKTNSMGTKKGLDRRKRFGKYLMKSFIRFVNCRNFWIIFFCFFMEKLSFLHLCELISKLIKGFFNDYQA